MLIRNPREQQYPELQSFVSSEYSEPSQPKMTQIHSNRVVVVTSQDQEIGEADGMVTSRKNLKLQVRIADCGNIYAFDPHAQVIGLCHSGRKGTQGNIITHMIEAMKTLWSQAKNIVIRTGPCISGKSYEFWPEVKDLFESKYYEVEDGTYYLDLPSVHRDQLLAWWILAKHIIQSDICTFTTLDLPSYRREGSDSGRITWSIMIVQ